VSLHDVLGSDERCRPGRRRLQIKGDVMGRSTLKEVAAAAGVSVPTASKVLNHRGDIAEETRTRVLAAAEEIGYSPLLATGPGHRSR
jgi:hypothetical protein